MTKYVLIIYFVLTALSGFYRPDFMSMTAISIGILAVEMPQYVRRSNFRMLVVFILITFIFDFIHLFINHDSREDDEADSGNMAVTRHFSYLFAWISFFFRPIVAAVFWKDSLDYMKIIKQRSGEKNSVMDAMY